MNAEFHLMMNTKSVAEEMLSEVGLTPVDSARLVLETIELLGAQARSLSRPELVSLLRETIHAGVAAMQAATHTVSLEQAAWARVEAGKELRVSTRGDLRHFVRRMLRVEGAAEWQLRAISVAQCKRVLATAFGASSCSYMKGRAILHSIFEYGIRQEWCDSNPVDKIDRPKIKEKPIPPLTPAEVDRLKTTAQRPEYRDMRFSLALMLYSGVRPAEVSRLKPSDICWEEQQVIIRSHASKTGGGRAVPLRGLQGISRQDCCIPRNWKRKWRALRCAAGFTHWHSDVCRHTFATYHAAMFRNLSALQLEMGHRDSALLRSRYMMPALHSHAVAFWKGAGQASLRSEAPPSS